MSPLLRRISVALAAMALACGGSSAPPSTTTAPPATDPGVSITAGQRLGWTQTGDAADGYVYAAYVDGVRNELPQTTCTPSGSAVYACESPLPPLTKGTHTLQLSAAI